MIEDFIKGFDEVRDFFLYGYCYWFAVILKKRFNGTIYYMPIKNHFIVRINNDYFDASGKIVPDEKVYTWAMYQYKYPTECRVITRDCINKYT